MEKPVLGGQAVVDGVLMLYGDAYAVAVQGPKRIEILRGSLPIPRDPWMRVPVIRGIIAFLVTMWIGLKAMGFATDTADEDGFSTGALAVTVLFSLALALILFKLLPFFLAEVVVSRQHPVLFNIIDGAIRILIFLGYLLLISRMKDVKNMFRYHGAEHMVINGYERSGKLSLDAAKKSSRFHDRCSTSFVVLVLVIAIIVFAIVPLNLVLWQVILLRLLLVIPIAGLSYELIRVAIRFRKFWVFRALLVPGSWVQRITTASPSEQQLRVAIAAARSVLQSR